MKIVDVVGPLKAPIAKRRKEFAKRILSDIGPRIVEDVLRQIHINLACDYKPERSGLTDADHIGTLQDLEKSIKKLLGVKKAR